MPSIFYAHQSRGEHGARATLSNNVWPYLACVSFRRLWAPEVPAADAKARRMFARALQAPIFNPGNQRGEPQPPLPPHTPVPSRALPHVGRCAMHSAQEQHQCVTGGHVWDVGEGGVVRVTLVEMGEKSQVIR